MSTVTTAILVLDGEQRASLAVVRSLGRLGYRLHVGASTRRSLAGSSRYATTVVTLPDPMAGSCAYATAVARACHDIGADLVLPVTEASWLAVLEHRNKFSERVLPDADLGRFQRACDKPAVLAIAQRLGMDVLEQYIHSGHSLTAASIPPDAFPVVVKPSRSVVGTDGNRRKTVVRYADSPKQLDRVLRELDPGAGPVLIQPKIEGPGLGVFLLRWNGEILASFAHRRIREKPPSGGVSVCCESAVAPPGLVDKSIALLEALEWSGVAMVEFKHDTRSGRDYLMEVNPRFWGSLQLAVDAGVDFPATLVESALGRKVAHIHTWRTGIRSRWFLGDLDHLITRVMHTRAQLHLPSDSLGLFRTAVSILTPWRPNQRGEILRLSDPVPALRELVTWIQAL